MSEIQILETTSREEMVNMNVVLKSYKILWLIIFFI